MYLDFTDMLYALSFALDAVEHEFNGVMQGHGKHDAGHGGSGEDRQKHSRGSE